jgi:RNA polymerase sigma-54 factor
MQKLGLQQSLQQKLSPQQIQFIKLLQIPLAELEARVEEELEINPALEEGTSNFDEEFKAEKDTDDTDNEDFNEYEEYGSKDIEISEYLNDEAGYKMFGDGDNGSDEDRDVPFAVANSLHENLLQQLGFLKLSEKEEIIGRQIIGTLDEDGFLRRQLESIVNDLAFTAGVEVTLKEVERVLKYVQNFDPPGIAARDLQECLLLQLDRLDETKPTVILALKITDIYFEELSKRHFEKIQRKLNLDSEQLREVLKVITKLNPKPGNTYSETPIQYLNPDFILTNINGKLELSLNSKNAPELKVSASFTDMLDTYQKSDKQNKEIKETVGFIKQKLDAAKWFIDAIKQRQNTLLKTANAIVKHQYEFFLEGDENKLKPMILKTIAENIGMDISTVSRVANGKSIQTEFGLYPLKYFFSEGIVTDSGDEASSREVKNILKEMIDNEDKNNPLSDDRLEKILNEKGYNIARRTVAKYRDQLNLPVARLRKEV